MVNDEDIGSENGEPTVLETDSEGDEVDEQPLKSSKAVAEAKNINATRDEVVAENLASRDDGEAGSDDDEDEIESARAQLREDEDEDEEDDSESEEEFEDSDRDKPFFRRVIERANGRDGTRMGHLRGHITGEIVLSITDRKEGYYFTWKDELLSVEPWSQKAPAEGSCVIELSEEHLEDILRGKLNPQVAMLSHKVHVAGEPSQAVYFFNLFQSSRRS